MATRKRQPGIKVRGSCTHCGHLIETTTDPGRVQAKVPCPKCPDTAQLVTCRRMPRDRAAAGDTTTRPAAGDSTDDNGVIEVPHYRKGKKSDPASAADPGHAEPRDGAGGDPGTDGGPAAGVQGPVGHAGDPDGAGPGQPRVPGRKDRGGSRGGGVGFRRGDQPPEDDPDDWALNW